MKTVLITGADRGMGLGFVKHYLSQGKQVIATTRRTQSSQHLAKLKAEYAAQLLVKSLDLGQPESIKSLADELQQANYQLDLVINNAGISYGEPFGEWTAPAFNQHLQINTLGPMLLNQALVPCLAAGCKLIQISSGMGSIEWNIGADNPLDAYAASKCALNILSRRLAEKLKSQNIIVLMLNPGWVQTDMGGAEAPTSIEQAIKDMTSTIDKVSLADSGQFLEADGASIPW
ncbi:short-chain dehydrogenase [Saccharobesus litoralis]|uniref:Short-chain dehydrogenase n=1 Tax=Saccharobesus litoralis TaxID=2172099 RepID=A0A2S0VP61_9ALTE|nr:SDR family oxidoreductase [Saccharobesus litoralis]AWB66007.1 short-chain dehydrogenase [Saccharobesus litoralis]